MNKRKVCMVTALLFTSITCLGWVGCKNTPHVHSWKSEYTCDFHSHWLECEGCDEKKDVSSHTISSNSCEVCGYLFTPTEGIVYTLSNDGAQATVLEYNGTAKNVVIAASYEGVPVTKVMDYAFADNKELTSVVLPDSILTVGKNVFSGCTALANVFISSSTTTIGADVFLDCNSLEELVVPFIGASIENEENSHIGYWFGGSTPDEHPTCVPSTLKKVRITKAHFLGDYAFRYCANLTDVTIPRSVTQIGYGAFYQCKQLKSIFIPNTVSLVKNYAFAYCYDITIYCEAESQPQIWDPTWNYGFPVVWDSKAP